MRILIVEDDPIISSEIASILEDAGHEVAGQCFAAEEAIPFFHKGNIDLALLDIQLEGDSDGVQLAHLINEKFKVPFIFLTSYADAITLERIKQCNPESYIHKPFDEAVLKTNIELALSRRGKYPSDHPEKTDENVFFVKTKKGLSKLIPDQIIYAEAVDSYTCLFTENERVVISESLKNVEEKLVNAGFVRVHRSFLINFSHITSIVDGYVLLGKEKVPIGRAYKDDLFSLIKTL
ncbi:MAG: response regulator [Flavobacteriales bacterium]|nr:response regulator [Flavobacteriales bacterium]